MDAIILPIHVTAGTLSVLAGAAALLLRKGKRAHRAAGSVFLVSMVTMAATAAALGRDFGNIVAGGLTIYMVATAWIAARRKDNKVGAFEIAAFGVAISCGVGMGASVALLASAGEAPNPYIVPMGFFLSAVIMLAALGDLSVVVRRGVAGAQRIARHLWRMCFGLFIAVGAFAAQGADVLPSSLPRVELLFSSMILVLIVMVYWLVRVLAAGWSARALQPS